MESLSKLGWHLTEDHLYNYFGDDLPSNGGGDAIHKLLLDCDIREIINCTGDEATSIGRIANVNENGDIVDNPIILQIQKVKNVAVPKAHENDNSSTNRLLRLTLTDGKATFNALEMAVIKGLDAKTPPGTKIQFIDVVRNERGFLLLTPSNCRILGGRVEKLIEKWRLKDPSTLTRPRPGGDGQGPPPWVPFGQKARLPESMLSKNLRVMDIAATGQQEAPAISEEFSQARQNVIAQAMQQQSRTKSQQK